MASSSVVVIDTSVLSTRPELSDIKEFLDKKLRVDWSRVKSVQLHNIKNIVLLGLENEEDAKRLTHLHHMMHRISCAGKELPIPIPIYQKSRAVDVRIHDLDEEIGDEAVINYLHQFGEVISIREEVWKNFFPGLANGVRVARMVINRPIPSQATIEDQVTLISYKGQPRCCKGCGGKPHPKMRCHEAATTTNETKNTPTIINSEEFPALPVPQNKHDNTSQPSTSSPVPPPPPKITDDNNRAQIKRQRSTETATSASKKSNNKGEGEYNSYLDPHVYFTELYNSSYMDNFKDEEERKNALLEIAERVIKLRKEDLKRDLESKTKKK